MRIVHVAPFYYPVIGGIEEVVRRIAEYMASEGHDVYVLTYNRLRVGGELSLPKNDLINGVRVIRVKPDFIWSSGTYSSEVPNVLERLKPDLVHVHIWRHPHVFQIAKLKKIMKFKAILHGHAPFHILSQVGFITWMYHRMIDTIAGKFLNPYSLYDAYDAYIALTPHEKDIVLRKLGFLNNRVVIIPNGIDPPKSQYYVDESARDNEVLYLGRISREKNVLLLIKSMRHVVEEIRDVKLLLVGPDEGLMEEIHNYAKSKNLTHIIEYLGPIYGDEKYIIYASSAVYSLPSLYEAFGITLLEASIVGTPSVITGEGGQLYVAPPNKVSLWAKPNSKCFANAIITLLSDKKLRKKLGQYAKEWAQQYTWSRIFPRYKKLYNMICV
jgi:glycosyltransferase involved in cell wall biosynthesis